MSHFWDRLVCETGPFAVSSMYLQLLWYAFTEESSYRLQDFHHLTITTIICQAAQMQMQICYQDCRLQFNSIIWPLKQCEILVVIVFNCETHRSQHLIKYQPCFLDIINQCQFGLQLKSVDFFYCVYSVNIATTIFIQLLYRLEFCLPNLPKIW